MRHFQELGHRVVFLIGDFTAMIGDPVGQEDDAAAAQPRGGARQRRDLRAPGLQHPRPRAHRDRVQQPLARRARRRGHDPPRRPLHAGAHAGARGLPHPLRRAPADQLHELLYPLAQGYDSVALEADVELGGTDQIFNLLVGRDLMKESGLEPQVVLTVPLLVGTRRHREDVEEPRQRDRGRGPAARDLRQDDVDPRRADVGLAPAAHRPDAQAEIAERRAVAASAASSTPRRSSRSWRAGSSPSSTARRRRARRRRSSSAVFAGGGVPDDVPSIEVAARSAARRRCWPPPASRRARREARRLIEQGAVTIDGEKSHRPVRRAARSRRALSAQGGEAAMGAARGRPAAQSRHSPVI